MPYILGAKCCAVAACYGIVGNIFEPLYYTYIRCKYALKRFRKKYIMLICHCGRNKKINEVSTVHTIIMF